MQNVKSIAILCNTIGITPVYNEKFNWSYSSTPWPFLYITFELVVKKYFFNFLMMCWQDFLFTNTLACIYTACCCILNVRYLIKSYDITFMVKFTIVYNLNFPQKLCFKYRTSRLHSSSSAVSNQFCFLWVAKLVNLSSWCMRKEVFEHDITIAFVKIHNY